MAKSKPYTVNPPCAGVGALQYSEGTDDSGRHCATCRRCGFVVLLAYPARVIGSDRRVKVRGRVRRHIARRWES